MRTAEWISLIYFLYLPVTGWRSGRTTGRGWASAASLALALCAGVLPSIGDAGAAGVVRDWMPGAFLLVGYWMSGPFKGPVSPGIEGRLAALDRRLLGPALQAVGTRAPRLVLELLEVAYTTCYPFIPAGLLWLVVFTDAARPDAFWTSVLTASFPCYALLLWFQTAPPRAVEPNLAIDRRRLLARRFNLALLHRTSVHANTFPSAHVAATTAVALHVVRVDPLAGTAFVLGALAIALATVVGRYHYGTDAVLGAVLGVAGFLTSARPPGT